MADFCLPDDIIYNIVARLPAKPLLRFRCVSRYWNRILREEKFMKLRSRKTIILPYSKDFVMIDENMMSNPTVRRCYPIDAGQGPRTVIGTINGIVLLVILDILVLYNPFTGVAERLPDQPAGYYIEAYGLGYGTTETPDDLKIVGFPLHCYRTCDVYSFKEGSWRSWSTLKYDIDIQFDHNTGHFVNGFLYWVGRYRSVLIAVNVKDIALSEICLPFRRKLRYSLSPLGTRNGCLCILNQITNTGFDMWVMTEHNHWSKVYSFEFALNEARTCAISIFDGERILMWNKIFKNLIIYDTSKDSYETLDIPRPDCGSLVQMRAVEYVESLVSPSSRYL